MRAFNFSPVPSTPPNKQNRIMAGVVLAVVVLLIFGIVGLRSGSLGVLSPLAQIIVDGSGFLQKGLIVPVRWGHYVWDHYIALQNVTVENEKLRLEVAQLQSELVKYREALIENVRLRKLLGIKRRSEIPPVAANIIALELTPWIKAVSIDRGLKDGVKPGMVAMAGAGVVGKVVESSPYFSKVMLLSDRNSAISALIQRNRVRGILKGAGDETCFLSYVEKSVDVEIGDTVITSGTDDIFPKGLLLGTVSEVEPGPASSLFQRIIVKPAVDLSRLEELLILVNDRPTVRNVR